MVLSIPIFFHLQYKQYLLAKTAWEWVLTNSNTTNEFYSALHCSFAPHDSRSVYEFERLPLVDDLIFRSHIVSGYIFFSCKGLSILEATVPNFLGRRKLLLPLPSFFSFIFYTVWQTKTEWWIVLRDSDYCVFSYLGYFTCLNNKLYDIRDQTRGL